MEVNVDEGRKVVELWLSNAEREDEAVRTYCQKLYRQYGTQGYLPVAYFSGQQDLPELTACLLKDNRQRMARREVERER